MLTSLTVRQVKSMIAMRSATYKQEYCDDIRETVTRQQNSLQRDRDYKWEHTWFKRFKRKPLPVSWDEANISLLAHFNYFRNYCYKHIEDMQTVRDKLQNAISFLSDYHIVWLDDKELSCIQPYTSPYNDDSSVVIHEDFITKYLDKKYL